MGLKYNPLVADSLSPMQWCMLERIGRARALGEVTQGKNSLQAFGEAPKTLFYHRKDLLRLGLITKQIHYQKTKLQNYQGSLFHLPRFYIQRRSKAQVLVHSLVCLIKSRPPQFFVPCDEAREQLGLGSCLKKLVKHADFVRFLRIDNVPYRTAFPEATESEWKVRLAKGRSGDDPAEPKEKVVRIMRLLDNEIDPEAVWNDGKDEAFEDEENEEKGDDQASDGLLDRSRQVLDRTLMHQAYQYLLSEGARGITQLKIGKYLGVTKLEARTLCRNLQRRGLVTTVLNDRGRQRVSVLVANKFAHLNKNSTDALRERQKLDTLFNEVKPAVTKDETAQSDEVISKSPSKKSVQTDGESTDPLVKVSASADVLRQTLRSAGAGPVRDDGTSKSYDKNKLADADPSKFTGRQLKRANTIIELVRQCRVIDDPTKVLKAIQDSEAKEGIDIKMDKKSLLRLLVKLSQEGQIKNLFVTLQLSGKSKRLHFVCEPDIDEEHPVVQSAVEQAKLRLTVRSASEVPQPAADPLDALYDKLEQQGEGGVDGDESPAKMVATYVRRYGLQPKFVRMRELHQILFYLTRGYAGVLQEDQQAAVQALARLCGPHFDDRLARELEAIEIYYTESLDWKMFIPPLPKLEVSRTYNIQYEC